MSLLRTRLLQLLAVWLIASKSVTFAAELKITLNDSATVHSSAIQLGDIAQIESGDSALLRRIQSLEIGEIEIDETREVRIRAQSVKVHLLFAGLTLDEFVLAGAREVLVTYQEAATLTDADIESAARRVMMDIMGLDEKDLTVRLQNSFLESLPRNLREQHGLRVEILPPHRSIGRVSMQVQLWNAGKLLTTRTATFDVRKRHRVAIARVSLSRDVPLDENSVQFETRFLPQETDELDAHQVAGQRVRSSVVAGSVLQKRDLQVSRTGAPMAIRKGESVRVVAVAGKLQTVLRNAEAKQDGAIGEKITLVNRDSREEITGTVVGPGQVRIKLR